MQIIPSALLLCLHALSPQCCYHCCFYCNGHSYLYWWQLLKFHSFFLLSHPSLKSCIDTPDGCSRNWLFIGLIVIAIAIANLRKVEAWWGVQSTPAFSGTGATFPSNDITTVDHKKVLLSFYLHIPRSRRRESPSSCNPKVHIFPVWPWTTIRT